MLIDIIFAVLLVLAILRGYGQGLIIGVFSLVAIIIGLAAAMKLSAATAPWIGRTFKIAEEWLPFIAFILVFLLVVMLIRLGAKAIEKTVEVTMLGWINKLAGAILYIAIYTLVFSVLLFYAEQMQLLQAATIEKSLTYGFIQPWGPKVIGSLGDLIPLYKDVFNEQEDIFGKIDRQIPE